MNNAENMMPQIMAITMVNTILIRIILITDGEDLGSGISFSGLWDVKKSHREIYDFSLLVSFLC